MSMVRILSASLDTDDDGEIIIRGVLDQDTLKYIRFDWYQREQGFSPRHTNEIVGALFAGHKIDDITIGMRGQRCESKGDVYVLQDRCFCINGGQRLYATAVALKERPDLKVRLGVKAYTSTTEESENDMFCKMNTTQVRVAASVLLRNRKKKSHAAALLIALNKNSDFALKDRIAWDQVRTRHELISGFTFARIVGALHSHKGGALNSSKLYDLLDGLDALVENIGDASVNTNIIRFYDAIDKCWNIRNLAGGRPAAPQMNAVFLRTIARLLSRYPEFWDGVGKDRNDFYFPDRYIKRLRGLKLADYVRSSAALQKDVLYELLRKRLNLDPSFEDMDAAA